MGAARLLLILAAPLLFASCLLTPGKFVSTLDIKRDRAFTFTYAGEVIIADPGNAVTGGFAEAMRRETEGDGVDEQETAPSEETEATVAERRANRSEARRVGQECVSPFRSRWSPYH